MQRVLRTELLVTVIEWENEADRWKRSQKRLKRAVNRIHRKVEKKIDRMGAKGPRPDEDRHQFANRLLDKEGRLRAKLFAKHSTKLRRLKNREERRYADYENAETRHRSDRVVKQVRPVKMFSLTRKRSKYSDQ